MKTAQEIKTALIDALRGSQSDMILYWDQVAQGPAYRFAGESEPLHFLTWASLSGRITPEDVLGYNVAAYFSPEGPYKGPDADGIFPVLI